MQIKLLKSLVEELAGETSGIIVDILFEKRDVNEFLIAKKMNLTINQVRNILYKLSAEGLVSFTRKKDKRKGWYIYFWTLNTEKCLVRLEQSLIVKIKNLESELQGRELKRFYACKACNIEVSEEAALSHDFTCEECAEVYELVNNEAPIREIKAKIARTEKELKMIQDELVELRKRTEKRSRAKEKKEIKAKKSGKKKTVKPKKKIIKASKPKKK